MSRFNAVESEKRETYVKQLVQQMPEASLEDLHSSVKKKFGTGMSFPKISEIRTRAKSRPPATLATMKDAKEIRHSAPTMPRTTAPAPELEIKRLVSQLCRAMKDASVRKLNIEQPAGTDRFQVTYRIEKIEDRKLLV